VQRTLIFLCLSVCQAAPGAGWYALAQKPDPASLQRYFQEGEKALAEGRYPDAERAYARLRELNPEIAEVHVKLGLIYFQQGKFAQAVPALRQALKLKPALPNADVLLAMSLSELGRYNEALQGLEKGFRRTNDPALKRLAGLQLQRACLGLQKDQKAVETALELNRLYPDDPEILYHGSRLYANFAYLMLRKLSEVAPTSVWRRQAAGETFESQGQHELALREYRAVLALDPSRPGVHFRLGRTLLARAQPGAQAEALKEFEQELQLDPTNGNAAYEAAESYRRLGQLESAAKYFEMALKYDADFEEAQIGLGRALLTQGKPDLALSHLQKAIALNPENEVSQYQLSQAYRALGRTAEQQKALNAFQRLRAEKARREEKADLSPREVTKQELDADVKP
jgi:tetratricopeptide (TPR) repeat protein